MKHFILLSIVGLALQAETFSVLQHKTLWPDGRGMVEITEEGISFTVSDDEADNGDLEDEKESRNWSWLDIQYFDRISAIEFTVLTYEDQKWRLGQDREYRFTITDGELSDDVFAMISKGLNRPVTNRVVPEAMAVAYVIPVKHLHTLGGCEGELKFTSDAIYYATDDEKDSREWIMTRDIQSVWSSNPYQLEVHVYDNNRHEFSRTRVYRFDLKERLDPEFYRSLKLKLYELEATHLNGR